MALVGNFSIDLSISQPFWSFLILYFYIIKIYMNIDTQRSTGQRKTGIWVM
jgi:hypothetical protein